jgi:Skp family chaperone for outer membrane proteins
MAENPQPARVALIDGEGVLFSTDIGRAMLSRIKAAQGERTAKAKAMADVVSKLEQEIAAHKSAGRDTTELTRQLAAKQAELKQYTAQATEELEALRDRELKELDAKLDPLIHEVMKEKNLDTMMSKFDDKAKNLPGAIDITDEVIRRVKAAK